MDEHGVPRLEIILHAEMQPDDQRGTIDDPDQIDLTRADVRISDLMIREYGWTCAAWIHGAAAVEAVLNASITGPVELHFK